MKLTAFSDYTLRVLMYLALERAGLVTIPQIAAAYEISGHHLTKVVQHLVAIGVVESVRGRGGGIRLARDPSEIRIGEILRSTESDAPIVGCLVGGEKACKIAPVCRLTDALVRAFDALYATLDEYTLADLVRTPKGLFRILIQPQERGPEGLR